MPSTTGSGRLLGKNAIITGAAGYVKSFRILTVLHTRMVYNTFSKKSGSSILLFYTANHRAFTTHFFTPAHVS